MLKVLAQKKGVSPLIATVLLIAFAVALGSVVMNWGLNLNLGKSADKCRSVEIRIRNIDLNEVCFGGFGPSGYINFILDNTGGIDVEGLTIWIIGNKETKIFNMNDAIIKKGSLFTKDDKSITYDFSLYGDIKQVQFIPQAKSENVLEPCPKNAIKAEKVGLCRTLV